MNTKPENKNSDLSFDAKGFLKKQPNKPGVYQMFDASGSILYVGKSKSLKKRLSSYFQNKQAAKQSAKKPATKTHALVKKITRIEVTVTATETEALLLEHNLIKKHKPPYNILLRDDKSYPYIFISTQDEYPRLDFHRGTKRLPGRYFGPYPSAGSVRESLQFLQKAFQLRQCSDSFFNNRSRPCLQHQIQRCTAPCVKAISIEQYQQDLQHTVMFLEGKEENLLETLADNMDAASTDQHYESAAAYRDQIAHLRHVREPQNIEEGTSDADIVAVALEGALACVQVITVRKGRVLGSRSYFPKNKLAENEADVLSAFLSQYYLGYQERMIPSEIIVDRDLLDEGKSLDKVFTEQAKKNISLIYNVRSHRAKWQQLAKRTAQQNLLSRLNNQQNMHKRFEKLQQVLGLETAPERIECFDISHSSGEATVASCIVFDGNGALKSDYRRFNIDNITAGDDYAAMKQALQRRYTRVQKEDGKLPDILLIDGGKGQLSQAQQVAEELHLHSVLLLGIAKGSTRKAGFETLIFEKTVDEKSTDKTPAKKWQEKVLDSQDPALHLLQQIRDEAHRFAITGHKQRRDKKRHTSVLEGIDGIGAKRRRELLRFFGGQQEIAKAGVDALQQVPGISKALAQAIYDAYHAC